MNLVTSLLKPQEPGLHFKNTKKIILFVPISRIMKFYVRRIPDIKEKIKKNTLTLEWVGFTNKKQEFLVLSPITKEIPTWKDGHRDAAHVRYNGDSIKEEWTKFCLFVFLIVAFCIC